jgi:hypothetical protein
MASTHVGAPGTEPEVSRSLRRRGALVLAGFGLMWSMVAASGLPEADRVPARLGALVLTAAVVLLLAGPGRRAPERRRHQPVAWHRRVGRVNLIELGLIAAVVGVCVPTGVPKLVAPLVAVVVGLHFVPLAHLFDQPEYRATALGVLVGAAAGLTALVAGSSDETSRLLVGALCATTLWATSVQLSAGR